MQPGTGHIASRQRREGEPEPGPPVWLHRLPLLLPNLTRAALLWLLVHAVLWATTRGSLTEVLSLTPSAALIAAAVTAGLAHVDARVMNEPVFYANLGVPRWTPALTAFATALTIDILLAVIV